MNPVYITVPFPRKEEEKATSFYHNQMGFDEFEGDFLIYPGNTEIRLQLRVHDEVERINREGSPPPLFRYFVKENYLSYCSNLIRRGVIFKYMHSDPGGHVAIVADPFMNTIELACENWEENDVNINPFDWPFYKRY